MAISKTAKTSSKKSEAPAKKAAAPAKAAASTTKTVKANPPAAAAKPAAAKKAEPTAKPHKHVPAEQRRNYIEVAAYFIAERHGFTPGRELQDWAAAEAEIDRLLAAGLISS